MIKHTHIVLRFAAMAFMLFLAVPKANAQSVVWKLDNLSLVGSTKPEILGTPVVKNADGRNVITFNGIDDGLIVNKVPVEGWKQFTIEVLFKPDGDGPTAPRLMHFLDKDANRGTIELRLTKNKQWFLDTFLKNGQAGDKGTTLNDSTLLHPTDRWYWVALVFDGKNMSAYVNGVKEREGISNFPVLGSAQVAIGVRLNKVNWFKGQISGIRFSPVPLNADALLTIKE